MSCYLIAWNIIVFSKYLLNKCMRFLILILIAIEILSHTNCFSWVQFPLATVVNVPRENFPLRTIQVRSKSQGGKKKTDSKRKQEICNMSLEHFAVPGSKEVLNIEANKLTNPTMRISQRDTGANCRRSR